MGVPKRPVADVEATIPGDIITLALTEEVRQRNGGNLWIKAGLESTHRDGESSDEATQRVQDFVFDSLDAFKAAAIQ